MEESMMAALEYQTKDDESSAEDGTQMSEHTEMDEDLPADTILKAKEVESTPLEQVKKSRKRKIKFPNLIKLPDENGKEFYAYDDLEMTKWLGKEKFLSVLRFLLSGLVTEHKVGDKGNLRFYKCTMMHAHAKAACLYTELEYEKLTIEAHMHSRPKDMEKLPRGRSPFLYIYCKRTVKDKNRLSWHRMTSECDKSSAIGFLKMYPTWNKGDNKTKINRVMRNQGLLVEEENSSLKRREGEKGNNRMKKRKKEGIATKSSPRCPAKSTPPVKGHSPEELKRIGSFAEGIGGYDDGQISLKNTSPRKVSKNPESDIVLSESTFNDDINFHSSGEVQDEAKDDCADNLDKLETSKCAGTMEAQIMGSKNPLKQAVTLLTIEVGRGHRPRKSRAQMQQDAVEKSKTFTLEGNLGLRAKPKEV